MIKKWRDKEKYLITYPSIPHLPSPYSLPPTPIPLLPSPYSLPPTPFPLLPSPYSHPPSTHQDNYSILVMKRRGHNEASVKKNNNSLK